MCVNRNHCFNVFFFFLFFHDNFTADQFLLKKLYNLYGTKNTDSNRPSIYLFIFEFKLTDLLLDY